ncbi:MAG: hypothetical protein V1821_02850 [bacterium]
MKSLPYSVATLLIARGVAALLFGCVRAGGVPHVTISRRALMVAIWFALACMSYFGAIKLWCVSGAIAVLTTAPVWILVRDALSTSVERPRVISDLLLVGGIICFVWPSGSSPPIAPLGLVMAVISAIATGEFYLAARRIPDIRSPERLCWLGGSVAFAGIALLPLSSSGSYVASVLPWLEKMPPWSVLPIFGAFAGGTYFFATERLIAAEPRYAGSLAMSKTVVVVLMSRWLLNEPSSMRQLIGLVAGTVGSIFIVRLAHKRL